jgi:hypothetical protein
LFGWEEPDDTDLVKDGAAAIRTLGNAIDTSMGDLLGGTSGQILAKNSNTNMDFTWITNDIGDITAVTASSPLTGGGTSGAITVGIQDGTTAQKGAVQLENSTSSTSTTTAAVPASVKSAYDLANGAIPKTLIDASGDLIVGTAADTAGRLGIGTAGQVLKVNSGATALEWGTAGGGGKVLQVVSTTYSTLTTTTSSTYQDSGLTLNITPTSSSSKIMVIGNVTMNIEKATNTFAGLRLVRDSTAVWTADTAKQAIGMAFSTNTGQLIGGVYPFSYLDSPATTSATTYKIQFAAEGGDTVRMQAQSGTSVITLMEIGA